jgi:signal transduction histidine kinase
MRPISLKAWTWRVAFIWLVCALITAAAAGWYSWRNQITQTGQGLTGASQAIITAVEHKLDEAIAFGRALSTSSALRSGDIKTFEDEARRAATGSKYWLVVNSPESGRQLVNTLLPAGTKLDEAASEDWVELPAKQGKVALKDLHRSRVTGEWVQVVQIPVQSGQHNLVYVLSVIVPVSEFQRILDEQRLPDGWIPVIVGSGGKIVARNPENSFIGVAPLVDPGDMPSHRTFYSRTLEGYDVLAARAVSDRYGFRVAVGVPSHVLPSIFLGPVAVAAAGGFASAALTITLIGVLLARITSGIRTLANSTKALGKGEEFVIPKLKVRELVQVGDALLAASKSLAGHREELNRQIEQVTAQLRTEADHRRNAEAALVQSQKIEAIGQLTGGIAHDFNNLLAVIVGNLDLLRRRAKMDVRNSAYVENALAAAERGTKLTGQLLVFSRSQRLDLKPVIVSEIVRGMSELLARTLGPDIQLNMRVENDGDAALSDITQLELAILNLCINAKDAMPDGGELTISSCRLRLDRDPELQPGEYVRLSVADTGHGMPVHVAAHAFEPFYTTKPLGKGTGLGLSQVYGLANRGAGTARIESTPGEGTTVSMFLKLVDAIPGAIQRSEAQPAEESRLPSKVLVVDDDPDVRSLLMSYFDEKGIEAIASVDGNAALRELETWRPDILFLDYAMPGITGAKVAELARKLHSDLPIVFITGFADTTAIEKAAGNDSVVLRKPFRLVDLDILIATKCVQGFGVNDLARIQPSRS